MELRQINTFIHAAQYQSFTKAALALGYTQSAVTVQIRLLEEELETKLFDRIGVCTHQSAGSQLGSAKPSDDSHQNVGQSAAFQNFQHRPPSRSGRFMIIGTAGKLSSWAAKECMTDVRRIGITFFLPPDNFFDLSRIINKKVFSKKFRFADNCFALSAADSSFHTISFSNKLPILFFNDGFSLNFERIRREISSKRYKTMRSKLKCFANTSATAISGLI